MNKTFLFGCFQLLDLRKLKPKKHQSRLWYALPPFANRGRCDLAKASDFVGAAH